MQHLSNIGTKDVHELLGILNSSVNEIYIFSQTDLKFIWANAGALKNTQFTLDELCTMTPVHIKPEYNDQTFKELLNSIKKKGQFETTHLRKDGSTYSIEVHIEKSTFKTQDAYIAIILDITDRKKRQQKYDQLSRTERCLSSILYSSQNEIFIFYQSDLKFSWANLQAQKNLGYSEDELHDMTPLDIKTNLNIEQFDALVKPLINGKKKQIKFETIHRRKNKSTYNVEVNLQLESFNDRPAYVAIILDITNKVKQKEKIDTYIKKLSYEANHDTTTGSLNRRSLSTEVLNNLNSQPITDLCIFYIDLDHFKITNDTLGQSAGDTILNMVSQRINKMASKKDHVIRFESDAFLFITHDTKILSNTNDFCEKILTAINKPFQINNTQKQLSSSIGCYNLKNYPAAPFTMNILTDGIKNANYALVHAKKLGGNNYYEFDDELDKQLKTKKYFSELLECADDNDDFFIEFQPIVNLETRETTGAEALLRLKANNETIYPNNFINILEESGRIHKIGILVVQKILEFYTANYSIFPKNFKFCFNVSVVQLQRKDFPQQLSNLLKTIDLNDAKLEMEITESLFAMNIADIKNSLEAISALGIQISVDDFGTGYSCLEYLRHFPINTLKIDKRFIDDCDNKIGFGILQSIISLGACLELNIIAEGIETAEKLKNVKAIASIYPNSKLRGQGYLFHKPMSSDNLIKLLSKRTPPL